MEQIIALLPEWVLQFPIYLGAITIIATALVQLPFLAKHEGEVSKVVKFIQDILAYFPTVGKNPNTKALEKKK